MICILTTPGVIVIPLAVGVVAGVTIFPGDMLAIDPSYTAVPLTYIMDTMPLALIVIFTSSNILSIPWPIMIDPVIGSTLATPYALSNGAIVCCICCLAVPIFAEMVPICVPFGFL